MMQRIGKALGKFRNDEGFTLVEMALVLIIIGIIIGAIVKGKDLIRGAEQKRVYSKFVSEWRLGYLNFYDRTGKLLGDFWDGAASGQNGQCDTNLDGAGVPDATDKAALLAGGTGFRGLTEVGLEAPTTNTANAFTYNYVNSEGNTNSLEVAFLWNAANNFNYMEIINVPAELALALDTMVDGEADGPAGDFVRDTGADWDTSTPDQVNIVNWKMKF
jgi:prepilin-type N-terminal cleavage/methylation domain-containing protein